MNYRFCSGEINHQLITYHSGRTEDLHAVINTVLPDYNAVYLVGFSLGGNLVLKYNGDGIYPLHPKIKASVAISVPVDLHGSSIKLGKHNHSNSILLHSGLNPAWHFWLSTRFSCCLKMKSVENILGYIREQFYRFSRGCKPRENLWNCSRKYTEMLKTDSFLGNKKLSFNQNVWRDHTTMQQDVLLHFWVIFLHWNQA